MDDQLRRRSVGAPAARSVLLTILGEFLLPTGPEVWHETLVTALTELGYSRQAARQAVARSVSAGWLSTERQGRRARVRLTDETAEMLRSGAERIYSFGDPWKWEGRWLLVALRVPEKQRDVRHRVRAQLAWQGFGSLGGGLWISPHCEREAELAGVDGDSDAELITFRGELGAIGDATRVISEAWDLHTVADTYDAFLTRFGRRRASQPEAVFRSQTELVHAWRKFPFLDPDLPEDLLPRKWPRARALKLFRKLHSEWHDAAERHFLAIEAAGGGGRRS
ncbi:MAG TPA: PaaX family transcriptional regulator C-terminal domain-containing protein [Solirubrobacterales bacterium]|nr:PaaX family transcriptional regulator C-terminal domain-containing protein [Solirubrobacterales bacterium]